MAPPSQDDTSSLEHAREHLYKQEDESSHPHPLLSGSEKKDLPHTWQEETPQDMATHKDKRHVRLATKFFTVAILFFFISAAIAGLIFYSGSNSVSVDKIVLDIQGPTTIAGGDVVPLSLTITNKNSVAIENATFAITFPSGTRDAVDVLKPYPSYIENLGTLASGASVTRSIKAIVFGGAGQKLALPISFSYSTSGSNARFIKSDSYGLQISTTPLSVAIDALTETVSGQPFTLKLTVSSNATVPLQNVVLTGAFPFGFTPMSSSVPLNNSSFLLGTLMPGARSTVTLTGTLVGQDNEQRVFHFTVGTAQTAQNQTLAVTYMTQDSSVTIAAPFINTTLALNGDTSSNVVVAPSAQQSVSLSYTNTLPTSVTDAIIAVKLSGTGINYSSVQTVNGFYNSADRTVIFSKDTDPSLAVLAPGASGIGTFTFQTLPVNTAISAPTITFTTSVSGTRIGQANVPGQISASATKTAKVATSISLSASSLHNSGPLSNSGPIPPRTDQATTYTIMWNARNEGSTVAGGTVTTVLPGYVSYTGSTSGTGSFSYNDASKMVTWNVGDLVQGASAQGFFQVSLTPSISQKGNVVVLTKPASFSGYDRFAGVQVSAVADQVTTETKGDPGYTPINGTVQ